MVARTSNAAHATTARRRRRRRHRSKTLGRGHSVSANNPLAHADPETQPVTHPTETQGDDQDDIGWLGVAHFHEAQLVTRNYLGLTRAVIGHGFHVRELLFAHEFASLRITTRPGTPSAVTRLCELMEATAQSKGLAESGRAVDHVEMSSTATNKSVDLQCINKHVAAQLYTTLTGSPATRQFTIEPLYTAAVVDKKRDTMKIVGCVHVSWAESFSTGAGKMLFASAASANALLESWYKHTSRAIVHLKLHVAGIFPPLPSRADEATDVGSNSGSLPPLRQETKQQPHQRQHNYIFFDEAKIAAMPAAQANQLRFYVEIRSGLAKNADEQWLLERAAPHQPVDCAIERVALASGGLYAVKLDDSARRERLRKPLDTVVGSSETVVEYTDLHKGRAGVYVEISDTQGDAAQRLNAVYTAVSRLQKKKETGMSYGQPVWVEILYACCASLSRDAYEVFQGGQLETIRANAWRERVQLKYDASSREASVALRLKNRDWNALQRVATELQKIVACDVLRGDDAVDVFWSNTTARLQIQKWIAQPTTIGVDVEMVEKPRSICVYGETRRRAQAIQSLRVLTTYLQTNDLYPYCSVCMMPVDAPLVRFTLCEHWVCLECIVPGIAPASPLPVRCPAVECGCLIHVRDVIAITDNVPALVETAVFEYVSRHPVECVVCPKPGCNQILPRAAIECDTFIACSSCMKSYCLECCAATGHTMARHDALSCHEYRLIGGMAGVRHLHLIRDQVLTLRCPHCLMAFLDFYGCTSVQCGNATCRRYFCANCLAFSSVSSDVTHTHIRQCPENPERGNAYVSTTNLARLYRNRRTNKLREYLLHEIPSRQARRVVLTQLAKDLEDLTVPVPEDLLDQQPRCERRSYMVGLRRFLRKWFCC